MMNIVPAHAGMILTVSDFNFAGADSPRTRWDDPQ